MKKFISLFLISLSFIARASEGENSKVAELGSAGQVAVNEVATNEVAANEVAKKDIALKPFEANILLTNSPMDNLFHMRPQDVFFLDAKKAFRGEDIRVLPLFILDMGENGGNYKIECSISITKLDAGDRESLPLVMLDKYLLEGEAVAGTSTVFFPKEMFLSFSETDEYGMHRVDFEAKNLATGEVCKSEEFIEFVEWKVLDEELSDAEISSFAFSYNTHFDKQRAYTSLLSKGLNFYKKGGLNGFNTMLLSYYAYIIGKNNFLAATLDREFPLMKEASRRNVIMLNAFMNNEPFDEALLSKEEIIFQNYMESEFEFNLKPYEGEIAEDYDLEELWGEFFALGDFRPVARVLDALTYSKEGAYAADVFSKKLPEPSSDEERKMLSLGRLYIISSNYLRSYLANPILHRYLVRAMENVDNYSIKKTLSSILNPEGNVDTE